MSKYLIFLAIFLIGCGSSSNSNTKYLVSAKEVDNISSQEMVNYVKSINPNLNKAFEYKAIKIVYNTTTPDNKKIKASGILVLPFNPKNSFPLSIVVDNHPTTFKNSEVPSNVEISDNKPNLKQAILFTSMMGFATLLPDYLGYGESKGYTHPYIMQYSAQASIDMLNAAKEYLKNRYNFTNKVFITGYSEGGYVAMAMAKKMQEQNLSYNIKALSAMAGQWLDLMM